MGVLAVEITHKRAAGTSIGFLGTFCGLGSAIAGFPLSLIIRSFGWNGFLMFLLLSSLSSIAFLLFIPMKSSQLNKT